ncbi:uncharacterized protein LOC103715169 [Phoenix dactylifera]|uniref:Uncharacterized protein LOC103715169 n=1 Tax=Phoenix dactylifera TaxID=42345 RepID=A0A8B7CK94_PHODC|nr:uncharacterized protein LOC103715169 [Phoenix dactylifera]
MGNYVSCTLSVGAGGSTGAITVILPGGEVRRMEGLVNAAELMLDAPGHFLVNTRSMQVGRRFAALSADEDLEMGDVYVMMPMKRLNSVITAADMAVLLLAANKKVRRASGGNSRVLPACTSSSPKNPLAGHELDEVDDDVPTMTTAMAMEDFKYRLCRSRKPTLETIEEEGISSRREL